MRRRNAVPIQVCETLEVRACPSSISLSEDGFLTIMCSSPTSVVHMTQYDHQTVVQVDGETPVIFETDAVRYLAAFAPNGDYLASLEIVVLPAVAGDVSLSQPCTTEDDAFTAFWMLHADDSSALFADGESVIPTEADISPDATTDANLISGFGASGADGDDLPAPASVDAVVSVDLDLTASEDAAPQEEGVDEGFEIALIEIFSEDGLPVCACL